MQVNLSEKLSRLNMIIRLAPSMKKNLLKDLSASTIQFLLNYLCGLLIFFLTSRHLDKPDFGELNWSLAIFIFVTTILSLRLEQIIVRKVAAGDDASRMLTVFTIHIFFWRPAFLRIVADRQLCLSRIF